MSPTHDRESEALAARIVACLPAATFEMETFCRLVSVRASREVPTAAVTCSDRPRLLLNPDFVAAHCERDEHLFLLVMHELWHVILAHTTLYPRPTPAHNIAFDAVINAGLAWQFRAPEYRGFLEALNPPDAFPALLLRPPVGWPSAPVYPNLPPRVRQILAQLYPPPADGKGPDPRAMPTYQEIVDLLVDAGCAAAGTLIGGHEDPSAEESAARSGALGEVVREIVSRWPPPPFPLGGRDGGGDARAWPVACADPARPVRRAFGRVLRRLLGPPGRATRRRRTQVEAEGGRGVLPNARDRLAPARRLLGGPGTLWSQPAKALCRAPERPRSTLVYLDVSGSMGALLPHLVGLLAPYVAAGQARVMQFSTEVSPLPPAELRRGTLTTTGGTDIDPVLRHALADRAVRRALVLTDGYTGAPGAELAAAVKARGLRFHVVLPAESAWREDLAGIAASMTVLPPLNERGNA
jgi:hypothetical protein